MIVFEFKLNLVFQFCVALIASFVSLYFMLCFLISSDLREIKNYPIFLMTLVDFTVTGPGFAWNMFVRQILDSEISRVAMYSSSDFNGLNYVRSSLQSKLGI